MKSKEKNREGWMFLLWEVCNDCVTVMFVLGCCVLVLRREHGHWDKAEVFPAS